MLKLSEDRIRILQLVSGGILDNGPHREKVYHLAIGPIRLSGLQDQRAACVGFDAISADFDRVKYALITAQQCATDLPRSLSFRPFIADIAQVLVAGPRLEKLEPSEHFLDGIRRET